MATGPRIIYVGVANGVGDRSSAIAYDVRCGCDALLGCLGTFKPNAEGERSVFCPKCNHATCISSTGQILSFTPFDITKKAQPRSS